MKFLDADFYSGWNSYVARLPWHLRDVHHTMEYALVQEELGGRAVLAVLEIRGRFIMQPFIINKIPGSDRSDMRSLYGFGGPVSNVQNRFLQRWGAVQFRKGVVEWCSKVGIVSEYCVLHPLMLDHQNALLSQDISTRGKESVVIDLERMGPREVATSGMSRRIKRGIKTAVGFDVTVERASNTIHNRDTFTQLYAISMDRLGAADRWRFTPAYLAAHFEHLDAHLFVASAFGVAHRALLVIGGYGKAYAHLLGSDGRHRDSGLDELLYFEAAIELRRMGFVTFFLGGGTTNASNDSLLAFKSGFSADRMPVCSYSRIFDHHTYNMLLEKQRAAEIAIMGRESTAHWFPPYRREFK